MQYSLSKKLEEFQDLDPSESFPQRRVSKTIGYQNSQSIQEEDEEQSSSNVQQPKAKLPYMNSSIQQPCEFSGSDMKVPTIYTNIQSIKSFDKNLFQPESKNKIVDISGFDSAIQSPQSDSVESYLVDNNKASTLNSQHIKAIINRFIQKMKRKVDWTQLNDFTLTDNAYEVNPQIYKWFTIFYFLFSTTINILSIIFIPLQIVEELEFKIVAYTAHCLVIFQITADIHFKRGPFHLQEGNFNTSFMDDTKLALDLFRIIFAILLILVYYYNVKYLIIPYFILQLIRQAERFENIYTSISLFFYIIVLWLTIIMSFVCLFECEQDIYYSLTVAVSILTHNGIIAVDVTPTNSFLLQTYMIIGWLSMIYTATVIFIWIKPSIKLEQEKEKHLASFLQGIKNKNIDYGLQCRCYSYLEYIVDEDIMKTRDLLTKKLSPALQEELQVSIRSKMVEKIKLFKKFSSSLRQQLIYWFEIAQYNPEENIVQEHLIEDHCLYYILKGKVKIQFQGQFQGKPKRTFHTLTEGQTFGEFSFISGIPPYISLNSDGLTTVLRLRRSDFLEIIKSFPQDNEIFCFYKDNCNQNHNMFECHYCKVQGHMLFECQYLQYYPQKMNVIEKYLYPHIQQRFKTERRLKSPKALPMLFVVGESAKQFQQKLSQEIMTSEDFPVSSQLPYSENQTQQSASYLSKTQSIHKNPDQLSENPDSVEDQLYDEMIIDPVHNNQFRKQQNKTTLRTAGFPFQADNLGTKVHKPMVENLHKEKLQMISEATQSKQFDSLNSKHEDSNQFSKQTSSSQAFVKKNNVYSAARSMHTKLTFRYQQQQSSQMEESIQFQQQQNSVRQTSNRSNTYSNPLSNNISNNPSIASKVHTKSARVSPTQFQSQQKKKDERASHSDQSLSEQRHTNRKKSTKTGTKVSILQSQFQVINTPDNPHFQYNEIFFNRFEKMHLFKYYNPHNNYDNVIQRTNKFHRQKKGKPSLYTLKCFVSTKIKRVKRLLEQQT
ncbi:unnamed protein product (macronuclear) [Paramecium tetraurelia]|uniref:Cyclic nucleotide-binding domain-containing protein n=1 Tax=Paramecium tetraurelia TaxID=5888 RepID=A0DZ49_PARTE|nr:uncharacterized protein GSPATT00003285001 [Paramecium tetraurelia]CAK88316.1 unnamed protein product [Paramecium tetraurelia]|eukprot:XP_001455713.1 hypothetical protein (macronuclear) [Paramecium tetraurelia strain d4-2]